MNNRNVVLVPAAERDHIQDTLDSINYYEPDAVILVIQDYFTRDRVVGSHTTFPPLNWPRNSYGGLFQKELYAFDFILKNLNPKIVLRLDADAVFIRSGVFAAVQKIFDANQNIGLAGGLTTINGSQRNFDWAEKLFRTRGGRKTLLKPFLRREIVGREKMAFANGYMRGLNALGAAAFFRIEMIEAWASEGWMDNDRLAHAPIPDDFLFSLHTYASGYTIHDIGGVDGLLGTAAVGLPLAPSELIERGKYIVHSVRSYKDMHESEIREFFKKRRN